MDNIFTKEEMLAVKIVAAKSNIKRLSDTLANVLDRHNGSGGNSLEALNNFYFEFETLVDNLQDKLNG